MRTRPVSRSDTPIIRVRATLRRCSPTDASKSRLRRVHVTNGLDVPFTDRFDDVAIEIAPGESESIPPDMAAHVFGTSFDPEAIFQHVSKRQGWNTPSYLVRNEANQTLAEQLVAKLKIEPEYEVEEDFWLHDPTSVER